MSRQNFLGCWRNFPTLINKVYVLRPRNWLEICLVKISPKPGTLNSKHCTSVDKLVYIKCTAQNIHPLCSLPINRKLNTFHKYWIHLYIHIHLDNIGCLEVISPWHECVHSENILECWLTLCNNTPLNWHSTIIRIDWLQSDNEQLSIFSRVYALPWM